MAKSNIKLPDGTVITVEGNVEEIKKILSSYSFSNRQKFAPQTDNGSSALQGEKNLEDNKKGNKTKEQDPVVAIVNAIKNFDQFENIEKNIMDRSGQVDRILLPLYISDKEFRNEFSLTSGEISKILTELGTPITMANVGSSLAGSSSKYVIGDKRRKKGQAVKYRISHRGIKYISSVIEGKEGNG